MSSQMKAVLLCLLCFFNGHCRVESRKLFMMLVDGFRWDYFGLPGLDLKGFPRLFRQGVKAEYMVPDFPTNSFPNYRTIETGLHTESHGFVGNFMFDEETGGMFELGETPGSLIPDWWKDAESFYITAEKQGYRTALYDWRGCQVDHGGWSPSFCVPFTHIPTREDSRWAIYNGLQRLQNNSTEIVYIYHEQVDDIGHKFGPNSRETLKTIQELDDDINELQDNLTALGLTDVNVIIVSDHGMTSIDKDHIIDISKVIDLSDIREITEGGTQTYIWPVKGKEEKVFHDLQKSITHFQVFNRADIADRWFLKKHRLMSPILVVADPGWFVKNPKQQIFPNGIAGNHGFDNIEEDMRSIFLATGPDFKKNYIAKPFNNVNVYQLICHVTGIKPHPHNGTWDAVKDMVVPKEIHTEL